MQQAIAQLRADVARSQALCKLYRSLSRGKGKRRLDVDDLLRAAVVFAVSALDSYVHELVVLAAMEIHNGVRPDTLALARLRIPVSHARSAVGQPANGPWLEAAIREVHSRASFQSPDRIAEVMRLVHDKPLWTAVAGHMKRPAPDVMTELAAIVDRRNKIVHESDLDQSGLGTRWHIDVRDTEGAVAFVKELSEAILLAVK